MIDRLRSPIRLGSFTVPNRIVMPPLVIWKGSPDGSVTAEVREHYSRSAGAGMVIVEATVVSPEGRLSKQQLGAFDDRHGTGLAELAGIIHSSGAAASIQLHHAGSNTNLDNTFGMTLVGPSTVPVAKTVPEALTGQGIERLLDCFAGAARRAAEAGFDAVEIHAAHGYLVSQFLSPITNKRDDTWGGTLENRARFLREAARRMRASAGPRVMVSCRLGAADEAPGGFALEEGIQVARWLAEDGMPYIHVSSGIGNPPRIGEEGSPWSDRLLLGAAVRRAVDIPVIGVGGIITSAMAEKALAEGLVDLVAAGRAILADPQWALKVLGGRDAEIFGCHQCRICHHFRHAERCPARLDAEVAARGRS